MALTNVVLINIVLINAVLVLMILTKKGQSSSKRITIKEIPLIAKDHLGPKADKITKGTIEITMDTGTTTSGVGITTLEARETQYMGAPTLLAGIATLTKFKVEIITLAINPATTKSRDMETTLEVMEKAI